MKIPALRKYRKNWIALAGMLFSNGCIASSEDPASDWSNMVNRALQAQPHWATMIGVPSTGLTQGFRYHYTRQYQPNGTEITNYGSNKGLELIVSEDTQVQFGVPSYIDRETLKTSTAGWGDENVLAKHRFTSANEENGNYVFSGSLGLSMPTGNSPFTSHSAIYTPALAFGKGWGTRQRQIAVQSLIACAIPDHNLSTLGIPISWNTGLQARVFRHIWPEIEANYTHWNKGPFDGKNQLIVTYGLVFDNRIMNREKMTLGLGYQEAKGTGITTFGRAWVLMAKFSF